MALPHDFIKIILLLQLKLVSLQVPDPKPSHILQEDHQGPAISSETKNSIYSFMPGT